LAPLDRDGEGTLDLLAGSVAGWIFAYDGYLFDQRAGAR